jgi:uncharacterized membrane protein
LSILLGALALRLYRLGLASLWYDETVSLFLARQDLATLTRHTAGDIHPPLYYYLLHFWGRLAGWSEFSAAFVSVFFGVLLVALVYRVGREWTNSSVGLLAALLVAFSPYNLWYSQEVRMYTLGAFLGLVSVWLFVRLLRGKTSFRFQVSGFKLDSFPGQTAPTSRFTFHFSPTLLAYAVVSALGLYTLYYFVFLLAFENLLALVYIIRNSKFKIRNARQKQGISAAELQEANRVELKNDPLPSAHRRLPSALPRWLVSQLVVFLLYLPWLPIAFRQATDPPVPPWRSFTGLPTVLVESFSALTLGQSIDPAVVWPVLLVIAGVVIWGMLGESLPLATGDWRPATGLLGYTLVPLLGIYALSLWKPLYHVRYVFIYSPAFYLLLALALWKVWNHDVESNHVSCLTSYLSRFTVRVSRLTFHIPPPARWLAAAALLLLAVGSAYSSYNFWYNPRYAEDDLRSAVGHIAERWRPGDAIIIDAGYTYTAFAYYYREPVAWRGRLTDYVPDESIPDSGQGPVVLQTGSIAGGASLGWSNPESDFYATTAEETQAALDRVFAAFPRVWLLRLYDTVVDPEGVIRDYVARHGRLIEDQVFTGASNMRVQGYLTTQTPLTGLVPGATSRPVLLGKRVELLGFEPTAATVRAGRPVDAALYWRARVATNVDERLFVGLYSERGELVASTSELPIGNALGTSRWSSGEVLREPIRLGVPLGLATGRYVLRVALYDPYTNEPL